MQILAKVSKFSVQDAYIAAMYSNGETIIKDKIKGVNIISTKIKN